MYLVMYFGDSATILKTPTGIPEYSVSRALKAYSILE
jgi:hypothetical protein